MAERTRRTAADFRAEVKRRWSIWVIAVAVVAAAGLASVVLWIIGGIVLTGFALVLVRQTVRATGAVMRDADIERSVLLLRPFEKDRKGGGGSAFNVYTRHLGLIGSLWSLSGGSLSRTFEEAIAPYLEDSLGPIFALGSPEERLPPRGGRRIYASDDEWEEVAQRCSRRARYVVVLAGSTPNLTRELLFLRSAIRPEKVFLLIEPLDRDPWPDVRQTLAEVHWSTPEDDPGPGSIIAFDESWQATLVASGLHEGKEFAEIMSRWTSELGSRAKEEVPAETIARSEWKAPHHERPINWLDVSDVRNFGGRANQIAAILMTAAAGLFFAMLVAPVVGLGGRGGGLIVALIIFIPTVPVYGGAVAAGRYFAERGRPWALLSIIAAVLTGGSAVTIWNIQVKRENSAWAALHERHEQAMVALRSGDTSQFRAGMLKIQSRAEEARLKDEGDADEIRETITRWDAEVPAVVAVHWKQIARAAVRDDIRYADLTALLRERGMLRQLSELDQIRSEFLHRLVTRGVHIHLESEELTGKTRDAVIAGAIALVQRELPGWEVYSEWPLLSVDEPEDVLQAGLEITAEVAEFDDGAWPQIPTRLGIDISWSDEPPYPFSNPMIVTTATRPATHPANDKLKIKTDDQTLWFQEDAVAASERNTQWLLADLGRALSEEIKDEPRWSRQE